MTKEKNSHTHPNKNSDLMERENAGTSYLASNIELSIPLEDNDITETNNGILLGENENFHDTKGQKIFPSTIMPYPYFY